MLINNLVKNVLNTTYAILGIAHLTTSATIRCYNTSVTDYSEVPVEVPDDLVKSGNPCLDNTKNVSLLIYGYIFTLNSSFVHDVVQTMLLRNTTKVLLLNWEKEASNGGFSNELGYAIYAVPNAVKIGKLLGKALARLVSLGVNVLIHVIAHSLGAQLAGYAGREAQANGYTIPNMTVLDPARALFDPEIYKPVSPSAAKFVVSVHCDMGGYGVNKSVGHQDIWPNLECYQNGTNLQPGCTNSSTELENATNGNSCSHSRCWNFFNVSQTLPTIFKAGRAANYSDFVQKHGVFSAITYIGPWVSQERGNFYLRTGSTYPWGLGDAGLK